MPRAAPVVLEGRLGRVRWRAAGWKTGRRAIVEMEIEDADADGAKRTVALRGPLPTLSPRFWLRIEARPDGGRGFGPPRDYDVVEAHVVRDIGEGADAEELGAEDKLRIALWNELCTLDPLYGDTLHLGEAAVRELAQLATNDPLALVIAPPYDLEPLSSAHVPLAQRAAAVRIETLRAASDEGHWWCDTDAAADAGLAARDAVVTLDGTRTYLAPVYATQTRLADALARATVRARDYADLLPPLTPVALDGLSAEQETVARRVHASGVSVASGGAGVGKTRLIGAHVKAYGSRALVCAFTGRSADVLRRRVGTGATLHSVLYKLRAQASKKRKRVQLDERPFALIVDEAQMAPAETLADLVDVLASTTLQKVLLVGDAGQLDSIGCGGVLSAVTDVAERMRAHANARLVVHAALVTNHRTGSALLRDNALRIRAGDAAGLVYGDGEFSRIDEPADEAALDALVRGIVGGGEARNVMFIGTTRKVARRLNAACTRVVLGSAERVPYASRYAAYGPRGVPLRRLRPGDVLTFRKNRSLTLGPGNVLTVINGELARLRYVHDVTATGVHIPRADTAAPVERGHRRVLTLDDEREVPLAPDWFVVVCGSEADVVVVMLAAADEASPYPPTRAHLYTAVTRARTRVVLVTSAATLSSVIGRAPALRRSTLADAIYDATVGALAAEKKRDAAGFERFRAVR